MVNPTNSGSVLEFIELSRYKELVEEEARIRQEKIDKGEIEEKPASAINPLRQPSLGTRGGGVQAAEMKGI